MVDSSEKIKEKYKSEILIQFERLKNNPSFQILVADLDDQVEISFEEKEFLVDQFRWSEPRDLGFLYWIITLKSINERIVDGRSILPEHDLYFIRLCGVLKEMRERFLKIEESNLSKLIESPEINNYIDWLKRANEIIKTLYSKFTPVELLTIEFLRNKNAHPAVSRYTVQRGAAGQIHSDFEKTKTPRFFQFNEIVKCMKDLGTDDGVIALNLANRIQDDLEKLRVIFLEYDQLPLTIGS